MAHIGAPLARIVTLAAGLAGCFSSLAITRTTQAAQDAAQKSARANALVQAGQSEAAIPIYKELVAAFPA